MTRAMILSVLIAQMCVLGTDSFSKPSVLIGITTTTRTAASSIFPRQAASLAPPYGAATTIMSAKENQVTKKLFIFGIGYTGFGLVRAAQARWGASVQIFGTCRSQEKVKALRDAGVQAHIFNPDDDYMPLHGAALEDLVGATHVATTIPAVADFNRDPVLEFHTEDLKHSSALQWAGYLSTTGVYGDHGGAWVDEDSETLIAKEHRSFSRLEAERAWLSLLPDVPSHIFRLAGIYGPGRSALDTVRRGAAAGRGRGGDEGGDEQKFVSRVHVWDICETLILSMDHPSPGRIYNVADNDPALRKDVMKYSRELLQLPDVAEGGEAAPSGRRRMSAENKRVSNRRIVEELGVKLRFPTYKEGLSAIHKGITDPFVTD